VWYSRYRRGGGEDAFPRWEFAAGAHSWDEAPAPAKVGRLIVERVSGRELEARHIGLVTNVMHWAYGTFWGAQYGAVADRARRRLWHGPVFGALVWASDYVTLPLLGVYQPIWEYDRDTLANDLSAHVVYGAATDAVLRLQT